LGSPFVSGKNCDIMTAAGLTAFMHPTFGYTVSIGRF